MSEYFVMQQVDTNIVFTLDFILSWIILYDTTKTVLQSQFFVHQFDFIYTESSIKTLKLD